MKKVGVLWDKEVDWENNQPFKKESTNRDYAVYTELGGEKNLDLFIAHFSWYSSGGLEKAWRWNGEEWEKAEDISLDGIFDKYKYDSETEELKKQISEELPVLNDLELEEICKDKLRTYELFPEHVPETKLATEENANQMFEEHGSFVFKPRYGFAGEGVRVIDDISDFEEPEDVRNFIVQRTVETEGIPELGVEGPHDMRTVVINGELQDGNYVRVPDEGLISNISRGGDQIYVDRDEVPERARKLIEEVSEEFERFNPSLFAVDIMFDREGRPWIVELNSKPGTYYHHEVKKKEKEMPKMKSILEAIRRKIEE